MFSGRVLCEGAGGAYRTDVNDDCRQVYQLLTNYQDEVDGGREYLQLRRFFPTVDAITVETYSPLLNAYHPDESHHLRINGTFGDHEWYPFAHLLASLGCEGRSISMLGRNVGLCERLT